MMEDLILAAIWWVIETINSGFNHLRDSGHPTLSLFLRWNIWMFLPFWLLFILVGEKLEGKRFYEYTPHWNKTAYIVDWENIKHEGRLYTISYETEDNVIAHVSMQSNDEIEFREKADPDYLIMTIKKPDGRVLTKTIYDKNGPVNDRRKTYTMLNPYKCSRALTIGLAIIMNICLAVYARRVYHPHYRPTKPEDYGITSENHDDSSTGGRINLKKTP